MTVREELEAQLALIQGKLAVLNSVPEDIYPFGTIALFASGANTSKWYYEKIGEETWLRLKSGAVGSPRPLNEWVLNAVESNIGYFEVYILTVPETPIYASS